MRYSFMMSIISVPLQLKWTIKSNDIPAQLCLMFSLRARTHTHYTLCDILFCINRDAEAVVRHIPFNFHTYLPKEKEKL